MVRQTSRSGASQTVKLKAGELWEGIELVAQPDPRETRAPANAKPATMGVPIADELDAQITDTGADEKNIQRTCIVTELNLPSYTPTREQQEADRVL